MRVADFGLDGEPGRNPLQTGICHIGGQFKATEFTAIEVNCSAVEGALYAD
jgi:hypothetical protein